MLIDALKGLLPTQRLLSYQRSRGAFVLLTQGLSAGLGMNGVHVVPRGGQAGAERGNLGTCEGRRGAGSGTTWDLVSVEHHSASGRRIIIPYGIIVVQRFTWEMESERDSKGPGRPPFSCRGARSVG